MEMLKRELADAVNAQRDMEDRLVQSEAAASRFQREADDAKRQAAVQTAQAASLQAHVESLSKQVRDTGLQLDEAIARSIHADDQRCV